jgi:hypothetical protein
MGVGKSPGILSKCLDRGEQLEGGTSCTTGEAAALDQASVWTIVRREILAPLLGRHAVKLGTVPTAKICGRNCHIVLKLA